MNDVIVYTIFSPEKYNRPSLLPIDVIDSDLIFITSFGCFLIGLGDGHYSDLGKATDPANIRVLNSLKEKETPLLYEEINLIVSKLLTSKNISFRQLAQKILNENKIK